MESNASPDLLAAATKERQRLEALLKADPTFQKLEAVRRVIELYESKISPRLDPAAAPRESSPQTDSIQDVARTQQNPQIEPSSSAARRWGLQAAQIREASVKYLRQKGEPARGTEIYEAIMKMGVEIRGKKPSAVVAAKLSSSPLFENTRDGYVLREW